MWCWGAEVLRCWGAEVPQRCTRGAQEVHKRCWGAEVHRCTCAQAQTCTGAQVQVWYYLGDMSNMCYSSQYCLRGTFYVLWNWYRRRKRWREVAQTHNLHTTHIIVERWTMAAACRCRQQQYLQPHNSHLANVSSADRICNKLQGNATIVDNGRIFTKLWTSEIWWLNSSYHPIAAWWNEYEHDAVVIVSHRPHRKEIKS
jgi:hypothetical protein